MKFSLTFTVCALICSSITAALAQDIIELDTTTIKGNTELPKAMYVVPWQDKTRKNDTQQKLVLHNLYSDLFDPVMPGYLSKSEFKASPASAQEAKK